MNPHKKIVVMTCDEDGVFGFSALSFVDRPAIEEQFIALSQDIKLSAFNDERHIVYGAVLIPEQLILRYDQETKEEYYIQFPAEAVKNAAYGMMKSSRQDKHTFMHNNIALDGCNIVETWLKEGEMDKSLQVGISKDAPVGTWFVGVKVDNAELWPKIKSGEVKGFSIEANMVVADEMLSECKLFEMELTKILDEHL